MSLIKTLKSIGANVSNVSISYRNKETGEQVRGAKITNGTLDIFTDPTLRLNALATCCASKQVGVSQTDPANQNETVSVSVDPIDIAATIASESGLMSEFNRLLAIRDDGSSMEELANSTKSILDNARNQAAIIRNVISKQARESLAKPDSKPATKPTSKKPEAVNS